LCDTAAEGCAVCVGVFDDDHTGATGFANDVVSTIPTSTTSTTGVYCSGCVDSSVAASTTATAARTT
jgi:hypothetical protein